MTHLQQKKRKISGASVETTEHGLRWVTSTLKTE